MEIRKEESINYSYPGISIRAGTRRYVAASNE
jgi:hypothetical protein